jgi:hypothetical protein
MGERGHVQVRWRMKIVMMTNTYDPHVGGVARSVESRPEAGLSASMLDMRLLVRSRAS